MILDRVTSLADLAFRGKTNKYYRQLAIITTGKLDQTWKDAMAYLCKIAYINGGFCGEVIKHVNYQRAYVKESFFEPPEQLELTPQPQKKELTPQLQKKVITTHDYWVNELGYRYNRGPTHNHTNDSEY